MKKSFTLIEMLVVLFIIVLLISILFIFFNRSNYDAKQNDNRRKKDMADLATAIEAFKADKGHYPLINWDDGKHAWKAAQDLYLAGDSDYAWASEFSAYDCNGTVDGSYVPSEADNPPPTGNFSPGTWIRFANWEEESVDGLACDDLSLQLLGKAYLAKMPVPTGYEPEDDISVVDKGDWDFTSPNLKPYLDEIPKDPQYSRPWDERRVCKDFCTDEVEHGDPYKPTADYDPAPDALEVHQNILYRYMYNSYYDCSYEAVNVGDRYWMDSIMQLWNNGDQDLGDNTSYYELGNYNLHRKPETVCGG